MEYFPLFIRIKAQPCLIAGGGTVALRKTRLLLRGQADVTVVAPELHPELTELVAKGTVRHSADVFQPGADLAGYRLVIAATDDREANSIVAAAADAAGIPCNVVDDRELSTAILPGIVDRSPLIVAVSSGGESPVMTTRIRQQIERLLPGRLGRLARFAGAWRSRVKEHFPNVDARRHFWQQVLAGPVARQVLKNDLAAANANMQASLTGATPADGCAWITGAGPGDPELLTLRAARALAEADTILHDRLVAPAILDMARKDAEFISVGKQAGKSSVSQAEINALLVERVSAGQKVCRLKGGDPFIFGRGGEEIEALEGAGLAWEVIPGVTAASGCAASAGIPLTHRNTARAVTLVTASTADDAGRDWSGLVSENNTLVIYMAVSKLADVSAELIAAGKHAEQPAAIIENGTTERQRIIRGTLGSIAADAAAAAVVSPAVLIVGNVADLGIDATATSIERNDDGWAPAAMQG